MSEHTQCAESGYKRGRKIRCSAHARHRAMAAEGVVEEGGYTARGGGTGGSSRMSFGACVRSGTNGMPRSGPNTRRGAAKCGTSKRNRCAAVTAGSSDFPVAPFASRTAWHTTHIPSSENVVATDPANDSVRAFCTHIPAHAPICTISQTKPVPNRQSTNSKAVFRRPEPAPRNVSPAHARVEPEESEMVRRNRISGDDITTSPVCS